MKAKYLIYPILVVLIVACGMSSQEELTFQQTNSTSSRSGYYERKYKREDRKSIELAKKRCVEANSGCIDAEKRYL